MLAPLRNLVENERKLQEATMTRVGDVIERANLVEVLLVMQSLLWGAWLLLPGESYRQRGFLDGMHHEEIWGLVSLAIGSCILGGMVFRRSGVKKVGLLSSIVWWLFIAFFFGAANILSTGVPTYVSIALTAGLAYIKQVVREAREV